MKKEPFIHLFCTLTGYYFFDVNTDSIVKISKEVYKELYEGNVSNSGETVCTLKNSGFLKENRERITEHPDTKYLPYYFETNVNTLLLQVTQNCNQRCDYCVYSGKYENRTHNKKRMSFEIARKGIDYIIQHSCDSQELFLGFYGGEPLLEFELIKKCVDYIKKNVEGKKLYFNITTNATLLTKEIIDFLYEHTFSLLVSLDGPEDIHNKNRGFAKEGGNPHNIILNNLEMIRNLYPEYYKEHVSFNTVLDGKNGYKCIEDFFTENGLLKDSPVISTLISDNYSIDGNVISDQFMTENKYAWFLAFLTLIGRLDKKYTPKLMELQKIMVKNTRDNKQFGDKLLLPTCSHHSGNCVPGLHKLFLTADGNFYPCEKISECSQVCNIGSIDRGIELERVKELLNIETVTKEECQKCWAYEYCSICLIHADGIDSLSKEKILNQCDNVRSNIESQFKDYCVYKELLKKCHMEEG